jgi:hypothetical protein
MLMGKTPSFADFGCLDGILDRPFLYDFLRRLVWVDWVSCNMLVWALVASWSRFIIPLPQPFVVNEFLSFKACTILEQILQCSGFVLVLRIFFLQGYTSTSKIKYLESRSELFLHSTEVNHWALGYDCVWDLWVAPLTQAYLLHGLQVIVPRHQAANKWFHAIQSQNTCISYLLPLLSLYMGAVYFKFNTGTRDF